MTEESCFDLENETLARLGLQPMSRQIHKETWGQPLFEVIKQRSPGVDVKQFQTLLPEVHSEFIRNGRIDIVSEENLRTMDELAQIGKQLMILTSRTFVEVQHMLEPEHHISGRVAAYYHKDNTGYVKPDPRVFDVIERDHGLKPSECVYVGDSPSDAAASNGAGMVFIASLESGIRTREEFSAYNVAAFIQKFTDLPDAINTLEAKL